MSPEEEASSVHGAELGDDHPDNDDADSTDPAAAADPDEDADEELPSEDELASTLAEVDLSGVDDVGFDDDDAAALFGSDSADSPFGGS